MKEKIKTFIKEKSTTILALLPFIILGILDMAYLYLNGYSYSTYTIKVIFLAMTIIYSLFFILVFITKNLKTPNYVLLVLVIIMIVVNQIKIFYTKEPVYFTDVFHLFSIKQIVGVTNGTLIDAFKSLFPKVFVFLVPIILLVFLIRKLPKTNIKRNVFYCVFPVIILSILFLPIEGVNKFLKNKLYNSENMDDFNYFVNDVQYYAYYGVVGGMYGQLLENKIYKSDTYNEKQLDTLLADNKKDYTQADTKPNIILIFNESFWDVTKIDEVKFDKELTSSINRILKNSNSKLFDMISPSYGGISSNVEFELLTGANTGFYSKSFIPYIRLYNSDSFYNKNSIIKELKSEGYKSKIIAATQGSYNPEKVYKYLKIDEFEVLEKYKKEHKKGYYVSDDFIADRIIDDLKNKDNTPMFYMAITMQNHMPYLKDKYKSYDISLEKTSLSSLENEVMLSYGQGIYDADKQVGKIYDFLNEYKEPTIVIFLGDHLPYLSTRDGYNLIDKLTYFNTNDSLLNVYRKYNTQALVFSNYNLEYPSFNYIGPDLLIPYVINMAGLNMSEYYNFLLSTNDDLPTFNRYIAINNEKNIIYTKDLKDEEKKIYSIRNDLQYKLFIK